MGQTQTPRRVRVYVAGPLTQGHRLNNVKRAVGVSTDLIKLGYAPFTPHLSYYMDPTEDLGYETWMDVDRAWVQASDIVWRIPGASAGADREEIEAERWGIQVVKTVEELRAAAKDWRFLT